MKILFALTYYTPHWTGLTEHARRFAEAFAENGADITVVAAKHDQTLKQFEVIENVKVYRTKVLFRLSRTLISPSYLRIVFKQMQRVDTVVCYTPFAEVLAVAILAKIMKKRFVIVHNGDLLLPHSLVNFCIQKAFDVITYCSGILADHLIAYTDDYAKHSRFLKHFLFKTTSIFPLFHVKKDKQNKKIVLPEKTQYVVGCAGRFVEEKGFDILLRAIPEVVKKEKDILFVFAGETQMVYERFFEKNKGLFDNLAGYFHSFGLLKQTEMISFFRLLDVFVLPSRSDCLALVQVEAMLQGVPVVASDIPGARVPVQTTGMGLLVRPEDPYDLAEGIIQVLKNKEAYGKQQKKLSLLVQYQQSIHLFESVLRKHV